MCDYLIVGINSDELVREYKNKTPNVNVQDRAKIVSALKVVDQVVITETLDKIEMFNKLKFNAIFIGDDWKENARWKKTEEELAVYNVPVEYLPYTKGISTTILKEKIKNGKM